jgi:hypothetical protein
MAKSSGEQIVENCGYARGDENGPKNKRKSYKRFRTMILANSTIVLKGTG